MIGDEYTPPHSCIHSHAWTRTDYGQIVCSKCGAETDAPPVPATTTEPCLNGSHSWTAVGTSGSLRCVKCGFESLMSVTSRSSAPPPPPELDTVFSGAAPLTMTERQALMRAGKWGLLRSLNRKRFAMCGTFSMRGPDMARLLEAAHAVVSMSDADADILLVGNDADAAGLVKTIRDAVDRGVPVWTEEDLVRAIMPTQESLLAIPPEAPF